MCQRCTLPLHADCVDKKESGICEVNAELTSFEIIEGNVADALLDKVGKVNQLNQLINEANLAMEVVNKKLEENLDPPNSLIQEWKLQEKKLKKFHMEKAGLESLIFVEVGDMSDEMRRYSSIEDEDEKETQKESTKQSFAKGIKDKVKHVLS